MGVSALQQEGDRVPLLREALGSLAELTNVGVQEKPQGDTDSEGASQFWGVPSKGKQDPQGKAGQDQVPSKASTSGCSQEVGPGLH